MSAMVKTFYKLESLLTIQEVSYTCPMPTNNGLVEKEHS